MNPGEILGVLASLFCGSAGVKIRFPSREHGIRGLALLLKGGYIVDCCGDNTFGITSPE